MSKKFALRALFSKTAIIIVLLYVWNSRPKAAKKIGEYPRSVVGRRELAGGLGPQGRFGCASSLLGPPSVGNAWSEVVTIVSEFSRVRAMTLEWSDLSAYIVVDPQECFREKRSNIFARGGWILCASSCFKRPLSNLGCNLCTFGPVEVRCAFGNVRNVRPESV